MTTPIDAGAEAHRLALAHVRACEEAEDAADEGYDQGDPELIDAAHAQSPATAPYCGCQDCDTREVIAVAWPIALADMARQLREAGMPEAAQLVADEARRMEPRPFAVSS